jgi:hypothetical protein
MTLKEFAKERVKMAMVPGTMVHKGKHISREVKSLADRIRKKQPGKSDEYAYRVANDTESSYVTHKKKSKYSGLKREGGKTEKPLSKD